jgi:uncharacterized protein (TIGR02001 family)
MICTVMKVAYGEESAEENRTDSLRVRINSSTMTEMTMRPITLGFAGALMAAGAAEAGEFSIDSALGFESRYVFRGVQYAETSMQPAVTLKKDGFRLGAWFNLPVGDDDNVVPANGEELDLVIGYSAPLNDLITFDVGLTYYTFPEAMSGFGDFYEEDGDGLGINTLEPFVGFSFAAPLAPSIYFYRDFMYDTFTVQGGVSQSFPVTGKLSFDLGATLGYVVDDSGGEDYVYGVVSAGFSLPLSESAKATAGVRYGGSDLPGGALVDDSIAGTTKSDGLWWGLSLSVSF